jgi:hypothetical protein
VLSAYTWRTSGADAIASERNSKQVHLVAPERAPEDFRTIDVGVAKRRNFFAASVKQRTDQDGPGR